MRKVKKIEKYSHLIIIPFNNKRTDCIRAPPRRGRYWEIHPRRPKDFSRVEENLEGGGDGLPNTSRVLVEYGHSLGINFSTGNTGIQEILPCGQGRIDSVKINPSLRMMREWTISSQNLIISNLGPNNYSLREGLP